MSFLSLLNHTCDIYHIVEDKASPGFNLPESPTFEYPSEPDISGQACHFGIKTLSDSVTQEHPANIMEARTKLSLPYGVDIRINDKIVDCDTKLEYIAEQPRKIRNHHQNVYIKRKGAQRPL